MPNKTTTQILKEFREKFIDNPVFMAELCSEWQSGDIDGKPFDKFITEALSQQQQEDYQWEKRFMELKKYLLFQERMVETHLAGRTEGDELILLETINEYVEEIEESEY